MGELEDYINVTLAEEARNATTADQQQRDERAEATEKAQHNIHEFVSTLGRMGVEPRPIYLHVSDHDIHHIDDGWLVKYQQPEYENYLRWADLFVTKDEGLISTKSLVYPRRQQWQESSGLPENAMMIVGKQEVYQTGEDAFNEHLRDLAAGGLLRTAALDIVRASRRQKS